MGLAIVTGASRGIGRTMAVRLAREGAKVACLARSADDLEALAAEHADLLPVPVDLVDEAAREEAVTRLLADHGPCDLLVNNAGYGMRSAVEDVPLDRWRHQFELNLFAATHLIQLVLPGMRDQGRGTIVNISSVAGRIATPFSGAYSATKFALEGMSDALRVEVRRWGIRVILVEPGPVSTHFRAAAKGASDAILGDPDSAYRDRYDLYMQRVGEMHDSAWTAEDVVEKTMRAIHATRTPQRVPCFGPTLYAGLALRAVLPGVLDDLLGRQTDS